MADARRNLAYSLVATAPSPAASGTSLVVTAGDGTRFPTAPFNATVWPTNAMPTPTNAEIVRVTAVSTDTLTITRTQESTSARTILVGDQIAATITEKTLTDIEAAMVAGPVSSVDNAIARYDGTTGKLLQGYTSGAPTISDTGVITATSPVFTTPNIGAAAFTTLNGGAAATPMLIGAITTGDANYSVLSFNNVATTAGINGIWGGAAAVLVYNVPSGGSHLFRINNVTAYTMNAAGDILGTGILTATTGLFNVPSATYDILINSNSDATSFGLISLNENRTQAGVCGVWGGPGGAFVFNTPTSGVMYWRINNATSFSLAAAGLTMSTPILSSSYLQLYEMSAPAAGAVDTVRLYADESGGKTRVMALFASGVSQQIAIEP